MIRRIFRVLTRLYLRYYLSSLQRAGSSTSRPPFRIPFSRYGEDMIERVVEIPWAISRCYRSKKMLEIGFARAEHQYIQTLLGLPAKQKHAIDILPASRYRYPEVMKKLHAVQGSVFDPPYRTDSFDHILCISTMEHFGLPSHQVRHPYGAPPLPQEESWYAQHRADFDAIRAIYRITATGGRLLLTLPYGKLAYYGSLLHYDESRIKALIEYSGYIPASIEYYQYRKNGYHQAEADELKDTLFQKDGAPAAAGLVCLELCK